jgi:hypothetical protein
MASHKNQCFSTSSSPLPQNFGYQAIDPPIFPAIVGLTAPIRMKPNSPGCDMPGDPNILLARLHLQTDSD